MNTSRNLIYLAVNLKSERTKRKKKEVDEMNKRIVEGEKLREINQAHHESNIAKNGDVYSIAAIVRSTSFTLIYRFVSIDSVDFPLRIE